MNLGKTFCEGENEGKIRGTQREENMIKETKGKLREEEDNGKRNGGSTGRNVMREREEGSRYTDRHIQN